MERLGYIAFTLGSMLGFIVAKFLRGWDSRCDRNRPGTWR